MRTVSESLKEQLLSMRFDENNPATCKVSLVEVVEGIGEIEKTIPNLVDINIFTSETNFSNSCTFNILNVNPEDMSDFGYYNPHRDHPNHGKPTNDWYKRILPNKRIRVRMGYGTELVEVFNGSIDSVVMKIEVDKAYLEVSCRDFAKDLMDKACNCIEDGTKVWHIFYPLDTYVTPVYLDDTHVDPDLSEVVFDICRRAGFSFYDINIEQTGIVLSETSDGLLEFENQNWDSCINRIRDISNFDFWVDEEGKANFKRPLTKTITHTQETMMFGIPPEPQPIEKYPIIPSTLHVVDHDDPLIIYTQDLDYSYDIETNTIIRLEAGNIPIDQWVYISYSHINWIFKNGLNIKELPLTLSHDNLYGRIRVAGDGGVDGGIEAIVDVAVDFKMWDGSTVSEDKVLVVVNEELFDEASCEAFAMKLRLDMRARYTEVDFNVIPLPHLQMYDVIQVIVYGTILEAYLIIAQNLSYSADSQLMTHRITAHHFAYAPPS